MTYLRISYDLNRMERVGWSFEISSEIYHLGSGLFVLGQEQDKVGGQFNAVESFIGELTSLHIWDHVITMDEVDWLSHTCAELKGNVKSWGDFQLNLHGQLSITSSPFCQSW